MACMGDETARSGGAGTAGQGHEGGGVLASPYNVGGAPGSCDKLYSGLLKPFDPYFYTYW